jgi:thiamine biosynthesis protein ThiI
MHYDGILIHYAELAIKGRNRSGFVRGLADNVGRALADAPAARVERLTGRLWVRARRGASFSAADLDRLAMVSGIANFALARQVPLELEVLKRTALELAQSRPHQSFRVRSHRVFKELPLASLEVDREVGRFLKERTQAQVKLKGAELEVYIEMLPQSAFVYIDKRRGPGGLPLGASGLVLCLLSGGIDSPVAAYRMQRRGCRLAFLHFHSQPFLDGRSTEKATELAEKLVSQQGRATLFLVPFGELQREVVVSAPPRLRVVLYRRLMLRIAGTLARRIGAKALVTGESLGQVASQTLTNLAVIDEAAPVLVLRPLVSFDKQEIIDEARRLGTYEISIAPDQDCCQLFIPREPETHAKLEDVRAAEKVLDIDALCTDAVARTQEVTIGAPLVTQLAPLAPSASSPAPAARELAPTED